MKSPNHLDLIVPTIKALKEMGGTATPHGFINKFTLSTGFLYRKETEFALGLSEDMASNFKISKALDSFDLVFDLENDFSNQENHNANLSLLSKF